MDYKPRNPIEWALIEIVNPRPDRTLPAWAAALALVACAAVAGNLS